MGAGASSKKNDAEPEDKSNDTDVALVPSPRFTGEGRMITMAEVNAHNMPDSMWAVVNDKVYDITDLAPVGGAKLVQAAGRDATEEFYLFHEERHRVALKKHLIGYLPKEERRKSDLGDIGADLKGINASDAVTAPPSPAGDPSAGAGAGGAQPRGRRGSGLCPFYKREPRWLQYTLSEKWQVNHDCFMSRFVPAGSSGGGGGGGGGGEEEEEGARSSSRCPFANLPLHVPPGLHLSLRLTTKGGERAITRAYTPIECDKKDGSFLLLLKEYSPPDPGARRPSLMTRLEMGHLSYHLGALEVGGSVEVSGPTGLLERMGPGHFLLRQDSRRVRRLGLVAGGTGITTCYRLARAIAEDPDDDTEVTILYASKTEEDILLRDRLEALASSPPMPAPTPPQPPAAGDDSDGPGGSCPAGPPPPAPGAVAPGGQIAVHLTLTRAPPAEKAAWPGRTGRPDVAMLSECLPAPGKGTFVAVCGPPEMQMDVLMALRGMGHEQNDVFCF